MLDPLSPSDNCDNDVIRHVPIHLVDSKQVALQGETMYLQFTEDDEVRLFQRAIDCHEGVFGLGFVSSQDDVLYDKISIVEIKDYNMMGDKFGIFLSAKVVGRAMLLEETQVRPSSATYSDLPLEDNEEKQFMAALCSEIVNRSEQVTLAQASEMGRAVEALIAEVSNAEKEACVVSGDKQEEDRWDRYRQAYYDALDSDTQGYTYSEQDSHEILIAGATKEQSDLYTWKELNAMSWAAFSTSDSLQNDEIYRLAALDNDSLSNRLLLATYWLSDVLQDVRQGAV